MKTSAPPAPQRVLYRVNLLGPPGAGKSSLIKRLVCHRFDHLPTSNDTFMGLPAENRHAVQLRASTALDARVAMLELNDQTAAKQLRPLLKELTWSEVIQRRQAELWGTNKAVTHFTGAFLRARKRKEQEAAGLAAALNEKPPSPAALNPDNPANLRSAKVLVPKPHPLRVNQLSEERRSSRRDHALRAKAEAQVTNPLFVEPELRVGIHGWIVTADLADVAGCERAVQIVAELMHRLGYEAIQEKGTRCPVAVWIVANKRDAFNDRDGSQGRGLSHEQIAETLALYVSSSKSLLEQIRRSKLSKPLLALVDSSLAHCHVAASEDSKYWIESAVVRAGALSHRNGKCLQRLQQALRRPRANSCTSVDILVGTISALEIDSGCGAAAPLWRSLMRCEAVRVKYAELSCKTNVGVEDFERLLMHSLVELPSSIEELKKDRRGDQKGATRATYQWANGVGVLEKVVDLFELVQQRLDLGGRGLSCVEQRKGRMAGGGDGKDDSEDDSEDGWAAESTAEGEPDEAAEVQAGGV